MENVRCLRLPGAARGLGVGLRWLLWVSGKEQMWGVDKRQTIFPGLSLTFWANSW
jgi:hypothetical protein